MHFNAEVQELRDAYRVAKFVRRHRGGGAAAAVIVRNSFFDRLYCTFLTPMLLR